MIIVYRTNTTKTNRTYKTYKSGGEGEGRLAKTILILQYEDVLDFFVSFEFACVPVK